MSLLGRDPPVLELLDPDDAAILLGAGTTHSYQAGDVLMTEGDATAFVVILRSGRVMVAVTSKEGNRLVLALRGPGDLVGEMSAIDGGARSATVTAVIPTVATLLPVDRFNDILTRHPRILRVIMAAISGRLRDSDSQRRSLASAPLLQRVAQTLSELVERAGRPCREGTMIDLPLPQHELAALIGATREGTAKALRLLREGAVVKTGSRRIVIIDRGLLKSIGQL